MTFQININNKNVEVKLEQKKGIKHVYLRVLTVNLLQIRANRYFDIFDAKNLIDNKIEWIEKSILNLEKKQIKEDEFFYLGKVEKIEDFKIKNIDKFYKDEIKKYIPSLVEEYSKKMDLYPTSISYRKNKRTWGSCNFKNGLNFNILLMKYPIRIMEYIVIHELAHIKHKNHSKKFWNLVEKFSPEYKQIEKEFKSLL